MIENIVRRAKKDAIKRHIDDGNWWRPPERPPLRHQAGVPRTRGPAQHHQPGRLGQDLGKKGERIVYVRTLIEGEDEARAIEAVTTGQYL